MPRNSPRAKYIAALQELLALCLRRRAERKMSRVADPYQDILDKALFREVALLKSGRYMLRKKIYRGMAFNVFALDAPEHSLTFQNDNRIPHLGESEFRRKYCMDRDQFESLMGLIIDHPVFNQSSTTRGRPQVPARNQVLTLLHFLGQESCTAALSRGTHFIGYGTHYLYCDRVVEAICSLRDKVVFWPDKDERATISQRMGEKYDFPYCVGVGDGTLLPLARRPQTDSAPCYSGRKLGHSITMFIINDDKLHIRSYLAGWPGSVHDNRVFGKMAVNRFPEQHFSPNEYILADSAVENCSFVVSAFKKPPLQPMPALEEKFNARLASARVVAEHTIGVLKGRFPWLRKIHFNVTDDPESMMRILKYIDCCVILHNLMLPKNGETEGALEWLDDEDGNISDVDDSTRVPRGADMLDRPLPRGCRKDERRRRLQTYLEYKEYCISD